MKPTPRATATLVPPLLRRLALVDSPPHGVGGPKAARRATTTVSLCFVATAMFSYLVGTALLVLWAGDVVRRGGWASPHALGLTHVLSLGFVTSMAAGVMYHITPRTFGRELSVPRLGLVVWAGYAAGLGVFLLGLMGGHTGVTAAGAAVVGTALLAFLGHIGAVAMGPGRRTVMHRFQEMALLFLGLLAVLGVTLAVALNRGLLNDPGRLLGGKIIIAVGGWLGILVIGMLYQLVPMFTPSRARPRYRGTVLLGACTGTLGAAATTLFGQPVPFRMAFLAVYLAATVLLSADLVRLFRHRLDTRLTPVIVGQLVGAAILAINVGFGIMAMSGADPWPQLAVTTALLGWAPLQIAANATRLVPFIVWQRQPAGNRAASFRPAPALLGWTAIAVSAAGWALVEIAFASHSPPLGRAAGGLLFLQSLTMAGIALHSVRAAGGRAHDSAHASTRHLKHADSGHST